MLRKYLAQNVAEKYFGIDADSFNKPGWWAMHALGIGGIAYLTYKASRRGKDHI